MSCVWRLVSLLALLAPSAPVTQLDSALLARLLAPPAGEHWWRPGHVTTIATSDWLGTRSRYCSRVGHFNGKCFRDYYSYFEIKIQ